MPFRGSLLHLACGACVAWALLVAAEQDRKVEVHTSPHIPDVTPHTKFRASPLTIGAALLAAVCAALANSAGIGGGPLYMPLFSTVLGFDLSAATALSHTVVSFSAIASSLYGLTQPSPHDERFPLADLDIVLVFMPALLFGVSFGVLLNVMIPGWLQTILLTLLLLFVINKTAHKGLSQWRLERKDRAAAQSADSAQQDPHEGSHHRGVLHEESFHDHSAGSVRGQLDAALQSAISVIDHDLHSIGRYLAAARRRVPGLKLLLVVLLWVVFLATQQHKAQFNRCSAPFAAWFGAQTVILLAATALGIAYELRKVGEDGEDVDPEMREILLGHEAAGSKEQQQGLAVKLVKVTVVMAASGACAGLLGIGGALIFNPFLLQLGIHPAVCASTSVLMILFSSSSIALSLAFQGLLNVSYVEVFAPLCFICSLAGVAFIGRLVRKTKRTSIIVFILTGLIILGTILTAVFGGIRSLKNIRHGKDITFHPFCSKQ